MLIACPECKKEVSDQAQTCPHCGMALTAGAAAVSASKRAAPVFLAFAAVALVLSLFTPRLLLFFPLMATFGCAVVSLVRKEKAKAGAVLVLLAGVGLFVLAESDSVT